LSAKYFSSENKPKIMNIRPGTAYIKKFHPWSLNEKTTALDLGVNRQPYHVPTLRETALAGV
jgi:hypothetical protein